MKPKTKNTEINFYYSGGFAEIVARPSKVTFSYIENWFSGTNCLGMAMEILNLPFEKVTKPILEMHQETLLVNLETEEEILYKRTIFKYKKQNNIQDTPKLQISLTKIFSLKNWQNTIKTLMIQSNWISNKQFVKELANTLIKDINIEENEKNLEAILIKKVWPSVIAIGILNEFFSTLLKKEAKEKYNEIETYISQKIKDKDWFFRSIFDQQKVKNGQITFEEYNNLYGLRADNDYELTCPRWREIPEEIKERIRNSNFETSIKTQEPQIPEKLVELVELIVELQILRSEAKRKTLFFINELRIQLLAENKIEITEDKIKIRKPKKIKFLKKGKGRGVSYGIIIGKVKRIVDNSQLIPKDTIGIFSNASPQFTTQFPKCVGLIFLAGGVTSHGAIVAREFKIPTLVDSNAENIKQGSKIKINGESGEWIVLK